MHIYILYVTRLIQKLHFFRSSWQAGCPRLLVSDTILYISTSSERIENYFIWRQDDMGIIRGLDNSVGKFGPLLRTVHFGFGIRAYCVSRHIVCNTIWQIRHRKRFSGSILSPFCCILFFTWKCQCRSAFIFEFWWWDHQKYYILHSVEKSRINSWNLWLRIITLLLKASAFSRSIDMNNSAICLKVALLKRQFCSQRALWHWREEMSTSETDIVSLPFVGPQSRGTI